MANKTTAESKKNETKKTCFVITPIGDDNTEVRRHIEAVIDICIKEAIPEYDVIVSHRISAPGSITKQILNYIYSADLVIANLTWLNPNVMYELAFRHAIQKPVILIKDRNDGCSLPFDIKDDRTIMYTDDLAGSRELIENIKESVDTLTDDTEFNSNPILTAIEDSNARNAIKLNIDSKKSNRKVDVDEYLIDSLERIEKALDAISVKPSSTSSAVYASGAPRCHILIDRLYQLIELSKQSSEFTSIQKKRCVSELKQIKRKYDYYNHLYSGRDKEEFESIYERAAEICEIKFSYSE